MFILKVSKTLLPLAIFSILIMVGVAKAQEQVEVPSCFVTANGNTAPDVSLTQGSICMGSKGTLKFFKGCDKKSESVVSFGSCFRKPRPKDYDAYFKLKEAKNLTICEKANSGNCSQQLLVNCLTGCKVPVVEKKAVLADNNPSVPRTVYVPVPAPDVDLEADRAEAVRTVSVPVTPTRIRYTDSRIGAQDEYNKLSDFCGQGLPSAASSCGDDLDAKKAEADTAQAEVDKAKKAMDAAFAKMKVDCRKDCMLIAISPPTDLAACKMDPSELSELVNKDDFAKSPDNFRSNTASSTAVKALFDAQYANNKSAEDGIKSQIVSDLGNVCGHLISKFRPDCQKALAAKGAIGTCESSPDYFAAAIDYAKKTKVLASLNADLLKLTSKDTSKCTVKRASDIDRLLTSSCDCRNKASETCERAKADALGQLMTVLRTPYCATCGYNNGQDGNGTCGYNGNCNQVSKLAQFGQAWGQPIASVLGGVFGMIGGIHASNSCASTYASYLQVNQTIGMQPQPPNCNGYGGGYLGATGLGLGGIGTGGVYNPYGLSATGNYNPYASLGMNGVYNPYLMNGAGFNGGISAGINLGVGNPFLSGGGYQVGGGYPGLYQGGYQGGVNPYAGGINGYNPQAAYGNQYGAQQQIYDAQARLQQMAAQNAVVAQSAYSGGMGATMASPYYNMGYQGGVNPYLSANMGVLNNFQTNPWAYSNPYQYTPGGAGISGGITAGISAGFNSGAAIPSAGMYSYNAYPNLAVSPYQAYSPYTSGAYGVNASAAGYGPYGNTGYYPLQTGGCGQQVGVQCGGQI